MGALCTSCGCAHFGRKTQSIRFAESIVGIFARVRIEKQVDAMEHVSYPARNVLRSDPVVELK